MWLSSMMPDLPAYTRGSVRKGINTSFHVHIFPVLFLGTYHIISVCAVWMHIWPFYAHMSVLSHTRRQNVLDAFTCMHACIPECLDV
jgi:hypothetical protein